MRPHRLLFKQRCKHVDIHALQFVQPGDLLTGLERFEEVLFLPKLAVFSIPFKHVVIEVAVVDYVCARNILRQYIFLIEDRFMVCTISRT